MSDTRRYNIYGFRFTHEPVQEQLWQLLLAKHYTECINFNIIFDPNDSHIYKQTWSYYLNSFNTNKKSEHEITRFWPDCPDFNADPPIFIETKQQWFVKLFKDIISFTRQTKKRLNRDYDTFIKTPILNCLKTCNIINSSNVKNENKDFKYKTILIHSYISEIFPPHQTTTLGLLKKIVTEDLHHNIDNNNGIDDDKNIIILIPYYLKFIASKIKQVYNNLNIVFLPEYQSQDIYHTLFQLYLISKADYLIGNRQNIEFCYSELYRYPNENSYSTTNLLPSFTPKQISFPYYLPTAFTYHMYQQFQQRFLKYDELHIQNYIKTTIVKDMKEINWKSKLKQKYIHSDHIFDNINNINDNSNKECQCDCLCCYMSFYIQHSLFLIFLTQVTELGILNIHNCTLLKLNLKTCRKTTLVDLISFITKTKNMNNKNTQKIGFFIIGLDKHDKNDLPMFNEIWIYKKVPKLLLNIGKNSGDLHFFMGQFTYTL